MEQEDHRSAAFIHIVEFVRSDGEKVTLKRKDLPQVHCFRIIFRVRSHGLFFLCGFCFLGFFDRLFLLNDDEVAVCERNIRGIAEDFFQEIGVEHAVKMFQQGITPDEKRCITELKISELEQDRVAVRTFFQFSGYGECGIASQNICMDRQCEQVALTGENYIFESVTVSAFCCVFIDQFLIEECGQLRRGHGGGVAILNILQRIFIGYIFFFVVNR